ncbi:MAG: biotin synthase BioB [Anaerovoracaceae bacterium]
MGIAEELKEIVLSGTDISRKEAIALWNSDIEELTKAADEIRKSFCGDCFDICTIVNAKSGKCTEDCKYCAQSSHYQRADVQTYGLLSKSELLKDAESNMKKGVLRYSIVTSGKALSDGEIDEVCESIRLIREKCGIEVCVSLGLLDECQFRKIKKAGASRVHCNLETSEKYFPKVCSTHTYEDKIKTIKAAKKAGLSVCSGGIIGLGETEKDRIDMIFTVKELGVKSVPLNFLNPIKGTPYENNSVVSDDEARRCAAVFRFIIPDAAIRLAGGRGIMEDKGRACFKGGANAAISGDMLTTSGITVERDMKMIDELGFEVMIYNG